VQIGMVIFFELIRHLPASLQTSFVHIARRQNDGIVDQLGSFSPIVALVLFQIGEWFASSCGLLVFFSYSAPISESSQVTLSHRVQAWKPINTLRCSI
jgi:hypothetical protein